MSLRVWLPLNGNLNNQGLSDIAVTNNGATVDNNGKIGKCYSFGTASSYLEMPPTVMNTFTDECSISMWLYITSWNTNYATIFQAGKGGQPWDHYVFGVLRNERSSKLCFTITQGTSSSQASYTTPDLSLATWYHLTFVYKPGHCLIYVNGSLYQDYTTSYTPSFDKITKITVGKSNNITYQSNCKLNDFRIYDHALSPKEIEILSRGLVCHYPLNGGGRGGDNLLTNTSDLTKWTKEGGISVTWDADKNMYKIVDSTHTSSRWGIYQDLDISPNTTYTISIDLAGASCGAGLGFYDSGSINYPADVITTTSATRSRKTYTLTSGASSARCRVYLNTKPGTSTTAWFSLPKLEVGSKATPWIPKSTDTEYTKMGYNSTTEYDVSGYKYNGTKTGIFAYDIDTPRYSVCTKYSGSNYSYLTSPSSEIRTIAFWAKWDSIPSGQSVLFMDYKSKTGFGLASNGIICSSNGVTSYTFNKSNLVANTWYHFAIVCPNGGSNASRKLYMNGVEQTATSNQNVWTYAVDQLQIGKRSTSSDGLAGKMSDFRLYATALSAEQVAELYNTAVSVTNNGTLMGYELVEV